MHFQAKKVFWNKWIIWCALAVAVALFATSHRYSSIGIIIVVLFVIGYIYRSNYFFYISERELICKGGLFFYRIQLRQITGIRLTRHPFFIFMPFKAMFRIRIRYEDNGKTLYHTIAPVRRDEMMIALTMKCLNNQQ